MEGGLFQGSESPNLAEQAAFCLALGIASLARLRSWRAIRQVRKIPFEWVMRMMILGRHESIDAQKAFEIGLVSEVTKPGALRDRAIELATQVASNSPAAVEQAIRAMWETLELPLSEAVAASLRRSGALRGHPDSVEGPLAWREKREPKWTT